MSFSTIRENKILANISEFTVSYLVVLVGLLGLVTERSSSSHLSAAYTVSICKMYQHLMNRLKLLNSKKIFVEFHLWDL